MCCTKLLQKHAILRNPQKIVWNPKPVCGIHEQIIIYVFSKLVESANCKRNPQVVSVFCKCKRNPQIVSGIRVNLRNPITFAESGTTTYIRSLRNPQQNQCADKVYVTTISTRNPLKFCKWKPLTFWNMFKDLSLEPRKIQTQNCAPSQCTVWPRNV